MPREERLLSRSPRVALGLLASLGACVLPAPRVNLEPHLVGSVPEDVAAHAPRLAVARFVDDRLASSRERYRPPLRLSAHGLVRRGTSRTGDHSFAGPAAEGLRRDAMATLARSGLFRAVGPLEAPGAERADLVLEATIEEFVGTQYSSSELSLLRAGFLRRDRDDPVGVVRVHFSLRRSDGQLLFRERLETRRSSPGRGLVGAALDAMATNHERLVEALHSELQPQAAAESRPLQVDVLDGCGLGYTGVRRLLADANEILVREARLRLVGRARVWSPPQGIRDEEDLLRAVQTVTPAPGGLVLALLAVPRSAGAPLAPPRFGLALPFGQHALVACEPGGATRPLTVVHEIAHLFGGVHVRDRSSVMYPLADFDARLFDPLNRRILRAAAQRPLGRPLPEEMARRVRAIYDEGGRCGDLVEKDDLTSALQALE